MLQGLLMGVQSENGEPAVDVDIVPEAVAGPVQGTVGSFLRWFREDSIDALIVVGAVVILYFVLLAFEHLLSRFLEKQAKGDANDWRAIAGRVIRKTLPLFLITTSAAIILSYAEVPGGVERTVFVLVTISAVIQFAFWLREILVSMVARKAAEHSDDTSSLVSAMSIIRLLINVAIWSIALILILDNLGVNVTTLIAGLGVGGIAIGLAAQGIFSDLFAALSILFDKPFKKGDFIVSGEISGNVEEIGLKSTRIRSLSGEQLVISNANLLGMQIRNYKQLMERRIVMQIGVIYQTPIEKLEKLPAIIKDIIDAREMCRFDRAHFFNFGASSLDLEFVFYILAPDYPVYMDERQAIALELMRRMQAEGLEFAYPSQTLFMANPDGSGVNLSEALGRRRGSESERPA